MVEKERGAGVQLVIYRLVDVLFCNSKRKQTKTLLSNSQELRIKVKKVVFVVISPLEGGKSCTTRDSRDSCFATRHHS